MQPLGAAAVDAIDFEVGLEDIHAFNRDYLRSTPHVRRSRQLVRAALTFVLACLVVALGAATDAPPLFWLVGLAVLSAWFVLFPHRMEHMVRRQTERQYAAVGAAGLLGPHRVELQPEWLVERTALRESRTHWKAVARIAVTREHLFVYVTGFSAVIIPRRAFPDASSFEAFAARAGERLATARSAS